MTTVLEQSRERSERTTIGPDLDLNSPGPDRKPPSHPHALSLSLACAHLGRTVRISGLASTSRSRRAPRPRCRAQDLLARCAAVAVLLAGGRATGGRPAGAPELGLNSAICPNRAAWTHEQMLFHRRSGGNPLLAGGHG